MAERHAVSPFDAHVVEVDGAARLRSTELRASTPLLTSILTGVGARWSATAPRDHQQHETQRPRKHDVWHESPSFGCHQLEL